MRDVEIKTNGWYKSEGVFAPKSSLPSKDPTRGAHNASRLGRYRVSILAVATLNRTLHERSERGVESDSARGIRTEGVMVQTAQMRLGS